jgi:hypothetical protein
MRPMGSFSRLREESNKVGAEFLVVELDTALTFLDVAETTTSEESRARNRKNAELAYKTALRLMPRLMLVADQRVAVNQRLTQLKSRLEKLGIDC